MLTLRRQYIYFESLEKTIKIAFALYLTLLVGGATIIILGIDTFLDLVRSGNLEVLIYGGFTSLGLYFLLFYGVGKISWLGDLHVWLDKEFFGFLAKSNETIFQSLTYALDPDEQHAMRNFDPTKKDSIAQSIFSHLSNHDQLFQTLLSSGIFRLWIWYWILIYGTFTFTILSIITFLVVATGVDMYAMPVFTANWVLALTHLVFNLLLGFYLIRLTKQAVDNIVRFHHNEITSLLRENITKQETLAIETMLEVRL